MFVTLTADDNDLSVKISNVKKQLNTMGQESKSTNMDFSRLAKTASLVGVGLAAVGVSVGAITALAMHSPAMAGAIASMSVNMFQLSNIIGQDLAPLFETIGGTLVPAIGAAIQALSPQISWLVNVMSEGIRDFSSLITGQFEQISRLGPKSAIVLAGAAQGFAMGGPAGMFMGAALGYAIENYVSPSAAEKEAAESGFYPSMLGSGFVDTEAAASRMQKQADKIMDRWASGAYGQSNLGIIQAAFDASVLGAEGFRTSANFMIDLVQQIYATLDNGDVLLSNKNGLTKQSAW
jgi:hypothetical protein